MGKRSLTQIVAAKAEEMSVEEKLKAITEKVVTARKAYGNTDVEITSPKVNTANGIVDIKYLSAADKVALASQEIERIKTQAIEAVQATDGRVLDREIERLLAVNSTLVNLLVTSDSAYI